MVRFELESVLFYWLNYLLGLLEKYNKYIRWIEVSGFGEHLISLQQLLIEVIINDQELLLLLRGVARLDVA